MHDPAANVSMRGMLNSIISESVWGSIVPPNNNNNDSEEKQTTCLPPECWEMYSPIPSRNPPEEHLISYGEFLETKTSLTRHERKLLKTTFTEPGNIGEQCREAYERCLRHLCPPTTESCYHILPSFFRLLLTLHERGLEYRIIFRTFGSDTKVVVEEYNLFCEGKHPLFPHSIDMSQHTLPRHAMTRLTRSDHEVTLHLQHHSQVCLLFID